MGVRFDQEKQCFVFDFEHDGISDIIKLTGSGYEVTAFSRCFYYGYEFEEDIDGSVRSAFIKHVKFSENLKDNPEITQFIRKAIDDLSKKINLYDYDLVVMPESSSKVNLYMLRYIYRFAQPMLRQMELVKSLPERISSDIAKDVNGVITDGKKFADEMDQKLYEKIKNQNVLVIDDIATSGSTLNEVLRALRVLNEDNNITIFSLIGRRDLAIEAVE